MREDVWLGRVHAYRYDPPDGRPRYHLLIAHGIGGHGGTYDVFCEPLAQRGVRVHSMDLPGHGKARNESGNFRFSDWLEDIDEAARLIKQEDQLPLFVLGSSQGSAAAFHSLAFSDHVDGAITMGIVLSTVPPVGSSASGHIGGMMRRPEAAEIVRAEGDTRRIDLAKEIQWDRDYAQNDPNVLAKKMEDPLRTWTYGYASLYSYWHYEPPIPTADNVKPVLVTSGGNDPMLPVAYVDACFDAIGGPKERYTLPGGGHQLMTYHTAEYVEVVDTWASRIARQLVAVSDGS